jgi:hypothetical protein
MIGVRRDVLLCGRAASGTIAGIALAVLSTEQQREGLRMAAFASVRAFCFFLLFR